MTRSKPAILGLSLVLLAFVCATTTAAIAQDVTHPPITKTVGEATHQVQTTHIQNAQVVHISNHQIVVKLENGNMELLNLPEDFKFQVDGKDLAVHDLKPGMKLTQEVHTVTTPQEVTTLRTVNGTVWLLNPPHVMLRFPDNSTKLYTVPDGIVFRIDGEDKTVFDLRKGMKIDATVLTTQPLHVIERHDVVTGQAPLEPRVAFEGPLLLEPSTRDAVPSLLASLEPPKEAELPKTASMLPLLGLLSFSALGLSAVLSILARRVPRDL